MGLYLSPWQQAPTAIELLWPYQEYPPLFPLLLGFSGAVHSLSMAHFFVGSFFILSLVIFYLYLTQEEFSEYHSLLIIVLYALSPTAFVNNMGILSETLYLFLSLLCLISINSQIKQPALNKLFIIGLILGLLVLTRSIGAAMLVAYCTSCFILIIKKRTNIAILVIPVLIALVINAISRYMVKTSVPEDYVNQFSTLPGFNFDAQYQAIIDGWFTGWQYYWPTSGNILFTIVLLFGIFSIIGLFIRLLKNKTDAIYVLVYLIVIMIWPHPGQTFRFLFPIQPLLIFFAIYCIQILVCRYSINKKELFMSIALFTALLPIIPTLFFTWNRYHAGTDEGLHIYKEFYLIPDLENARKSASLQQTMFNDFEKMKNDTEVNDIVAYFEPEYVAYLAKRQGQFIEYKLNDKEEIELIRPLDADYILLTRLHPRKTRDSINGLNTYQFFKDWTSLEWVSYTKDKKPVSYFLKTSNSRN